MFLINYILRKRIGWIFLFTYFQLSFAYYLSGRTFSDGCPTVNKSKADGKPTANLSKHLPGKNKQFAAVTEQKTSNHLHLLLFSYIKQTLHDYGADL